MLCFSFSDVSFVFCFVSVLFAYYPEAATLYSIVLRSSICMRPDSHTQLTNKTVCVLFLFSLEMSLFPRIFVPLPFYLCMESTSYVSPSGWCFFTL